MPPRTARRQRRSWSSVLRWGLLWMAAAQTAMVAFLEWRCPEFLDPKYGCRMLALRALRQQQQERPLWLLLGSSRAEQGFRASLLEPTGETPVPPAPLFYNLARGGSSPLLYLLTLRRLLADGMRPDCLLVEIFPPALVEDEGGAIIYKPTLRDWPWLRRYPVAGRTWAFWLQDRLLLWYKYRNGFLAWAAPAVLSPQARWGDRLWNYQGGEWRIVNDGVSANERRRLTDDAHHRYAHSLQHFHVAADADRALRELVELCRAQRINVVLFLMPEASEYRSWYPAPTQTHLADYLASLHGECGLPIIDARSWIDDEQFSDGHHLLKRGAAVFTRRFAAAVLSALHPQIRERPSRRTP